MRRNSFQITAEILTVALKGAKKTHLVYKANLNFKIVERYLARLKSLGLIEERGRELKTTGKGLRYLETYNKLTSSI